MHESDSNKLTPLFAQNQQELASSPLLSLFDQDPTRASSYTLEAANLTLDYSKNFCNATTLQLFERLATQIDLRGQIDALFSGAIVNSTEQRPALHTALRSQDPNAPMHQEVQAVLAQMHKLVTAVHRGDHRSFAEKPITDVINIGIGGSDLGPRFVANALAAFQQPALRVHFVANVDPNELADTLARLDPASTMIITASKSFATIETLTNSKAARDWLVAAAGDRPIDHQLVAITSKPEKALAFGVKEENIYPMWDWVGGRYSLWSAIGLPIAMAVGWDNFDALLRGGAAMDEHYRTALPLASMPTLLAMLECWYSGYWGAHSVAILPYSHRLGLFSRFLQQLSMESLGKSVDREGAPLTVPSGLVLWGEPGSNCQHSFMQLMHQGKRFIPADFIGVLRAEEPANKQNGQLFANCLGQSRALMTGKSLEVVRKELEASGLDAVAAQALAPHKVLPGNRPSNTLLLPELTPFTLGSLIALYEHKVHAQGAIWNINAFDQWGVELGKQIAGHIFDAIEGEAAPDLDASTLQLIQRFQNAAPD